MEKSQLRINNISCFRCYLLISTGTCSLKASRMITSIELRNFRGFREHILPFVPLTVLVGENNAGKTTIVEALRLVSIVTQRFRHLTYQHPTADSELPRRLIGVSPSLKDMEISFDSIFHRYGSPPGTIISTFSNGTSITIYILLDERVHAVVRDSKGNIVCNKSQAKIVEIPQVSIMPQVAPLQRVEMCRDSDYIKATMTSRLAPLHFRNQLFVKDDLFEDFRRIVEETWPGVQVYELILRRDSNIHLLAKTQLFLEIRNEDFVAEVAEMGHGLQMWLQTMWFLTHASGSSTVILDEPDVYMHADLQHRIIRLLRNRHGQTIITTHSPEIMSEVQPDDILVVNKRRRKSCFAGSLPTVQAAIDHFGSVHNIHLTRLLEAKKMILVEGNDLKILKEFQDTLFPESVTPFLGLPNMSIGGWGGWKMAVGASMGFHNALGEDIITYCILDSDYHSTEEISEKYREAQQKNIQLHIWEQKEIENYLLHPDAISRVIEKRIAKRTKSPTANEVRGKLEDIAKTMKDNILDAIATEFWNNNRTLGQSGANKAARKRISDVEQRHGTLTPIASGKQILGSVSDWSNSEFGVSFSAINIAREMTVLEIPFEANSIVEAFEGGVPISVSPEQFKKRKLVTGDKKLTSPRSRVKRKLKKTT